MLHILKRLSIVIAISLMPLTAMAVDCEPAWESLSNSEAIAIATQCIDSGNYSGEELAIFYYNRAWSHGEILNYQLAILDYTRAIELYPGDADYYHNRAREFYSIGKNNRAIQDFNTALKMSPEDVDSLYAMVIYYPTIVGVTVEP